jgi:integrase
MEAGFITWADCDFSKGKIVVKGDPVTATKNGEFRIVPMIPEMKNLLQTLRSERSDEKADSRVMRVRECVAPADENCAVRSQDNHRHGTSQHHNQKYPHRSFAARPSQCCYGLRQRLDLGWFLAYIGRR